MQRTLALIVLGLAVIVNAAPAPGDGVQNALQALTPALQQQLQGLRSECKNGKCTGEELKKITNSLLNIFQSTFGFKSTDADKEDLTKALVRTSNALVPLGKQGNNNGNTKNGSSSSDGSNFNTEEYTRLILEAIGKIVQRHIDAYRKWSTQFTQRRGGSRSYIPFYNFY